MRQWPEDPAELLGVDDDVDRKTLRRVYSRLVKHYKPEHAPEQFQRIRDAYESMLELVSWRERFPEDAFDADDDLDEAETASGLPGSDDSDEETDTGEAGRAERELSGGGRRLESAGAVEAGRPDAERAWELATAGDWNAAYRMLKECHAERPGDEETCIRLYWLLKIAPDLDTSRQAIDWLVAGMKNNGLSDWCFSLYGDELTENPDAAASGHFRELIRVPASLWHVSEVVRAHWSAAAARNDWHQIVEQLQSVRAIFAGADDSEAWVRLLFAALDLLCWAPYRDDPELNAVVDAIFDEIRSYEELELSMSNDFDRCEYLMNLTDDCHMFAAEDSGGQRAAWAENKLDDLARHWRAQIPELLERGWNRVDQRLRSRLIEFVEPWITNPHHGLHLLDAVLERSPATVDRLADLLNRFDETYEYFDDEETAVPGIEQTLWNRLATTQWPDYEEFRPHLCDFCLAESVPLYFVENIIAGNSERFAILGDEFVHKLAEDAALNCLLSAHCAFWSAYTNG